MWIENDWKTQKARENLKRWDRLSTDDQHSTIGIYIGYYRPGGLEDLGRHLKQDRGWERGEIKKWITTNNPSWDQGDLRNSSILIVTLWKDQESWFSRRSAQAQGADCQKSQASAECAECAEGAEGAECSGEGLAARCSKAFHGFSRSCRIQGAAEQIKERLHLYSRSRCGCFQSTPQLHSKPVHSVHCVCVCGESYCLEGFANRRPKGGGCISGHLAITKWIILHNFTIIILQEATGDCWRLKALGPRIIVLWREAPLQDPEVQQLLSELYAGKPLEMHVKALEKHFAHCKIM